jgi:hypothetical protein
VSYLLMFEFEQLPFPSLNNTARRMALVAVRSLVGKKTHYFHEYRLEILSWYFIRVAAFKRLDLPW